MTDQELKEIEERVQKEPAARFIRNARNDQIKLLSYIRELRMEVEAERARAIKYYSMWDELATASEEIFAVARKKGLLSEKPKT